MDVGFEIYPHITVRIIGAYAPEIKGIEKVQGFISKDYVEKVFQESKLIEIITKKDKSFERYLAEVFVDGKNLAEHLVAKGYASVSQYK